MKRPWKARRNEVMTHSAALVDKLLLDNIAQEIVYDNDAVTVTQRHPDQGLSEITGLRRNACSEVLENKALRGLRIRVTGNRRSNLFKE